LSFPLLLVACGLCQVVATKERGCCQPASGGFGSARPATPERKGTQHRDGAGRRGRGGERGTGREGTRVGRSRAALVPDHCELRPRSSWAPPSICPRAAACCSAAFSCIQRIQLQIAPLSVFPPFLSSRVQPYPSVASVPHGGGRWPVLRPLAAFSSNRCCCVTPHFHCLAVA
jgi:hypothetical protein